jgi:hypothetical protein
MLKDMGGKLMAFGQALGGMTMSDEVVKGAIAGYVFENVEIATYTILIAAAEQAGDTETQRACEQIIQEERAMAEWLLVHLPSVTKQFLVRSAIPDATEKMQLIHLLPRIAEAATVLLDIRKRCFTSSLISERLATPQQHVNISRPIRQRIERWPGPWFWQWRQFRREPATTVLIQVPE